MTTTRQRVRRISGTRYLWIDDVRGQSWCLHEADDPLPLGFNDPADPDSGYAQAAVLRHGRGFALFVSDRSTPGRPARSLNAAGPEVLRRIHAATLQRRRSS